MQIKHNRIKNPNWQEATSWLFTSVAEDLNLGWLRTNPASGQSGTLTWDQGSKLTFSFGSQLATNGKIWVARS